MTAEGNPIELSPEEINDIQAILRLRNRLQSGVLDSPNLGPRSRDGMTLEEALQKLPQRKATAGEEKFEQKIGEMQGHRQLIDVMWDIGLLSRHRRPRHKLVTDPRTKKVLSDFGILEQRLTHDENSLNPFVLQVPDEEDKSAGFAQSPRAEAETTPEDQAVHEVQPIATGSTEPTAPQPRKADLVKDSIAQFDPQMAQRLNASGLTIQAVTTVEKPQVPTLAHDLARVLFNPGVYHLQDPRSGVYNFDPSLQRLLPVTEFNFDALNPYVTSSEDQKLRKLALENKKRYMGSSSSMNGILTHLHYLLSQFRELNTSTLSRAFYDQPTSFTSLQKCPSALFLRFKDGIYAIDADKEFDSATLLMELGKSMEKLLTLPKERFEEYRRDRRAEAQGQKTKVLAEPEAFHYCVQGDIIMRSQLDAYDHRLPGSGMFDLKTRAVVSIRMNARRHEEGLGYQIKSRYGEWESYEREYYDMIRNAFLKYSLQARMGRMDGMFVTYHNIERIFGFQYIPLSELDLHLHGQEHRVLGDKEFQLSVRLINEIFDRVTNRFPAKSLRFHFETRSALQSDPGPSMYIFAQPFEEAEVDSIQESRKKEVAAIQSRILDTSIPAVTAEDFSETNVEDDPEGRNEELTSNTQKTNEGRPIFAATLKIRNVVNGLIVPRPLDLGTEDDWMVDYEFIEHSEAHAKALLIACQNRRKSMQNLANNENVVANAYFRRLKAISEQGAEWRKEQDELEAQRGQKLLYPEKV